MDGAVAVLSMGLAPYNLLDRALSQEIIAGLDWARREGARAVVLRSSLRHFSAGADLDAMVADADQPTSSTGVSSRRCGPSTSTRPPSSPASTGSASGADSSSRWRAT